MTSEPLSFLLYNEKYEIQVNQVRIPLELSISSPSYLYVHNVCPHQSPCWCLIGRGTKLHLKCLLRNRVFPFSPQPCLLSDERAMWDKAQACHDAKSLRCSHDFLERMFISLCHLVIPAIISELWLEQSAASMTEFNCSSAYPAVAW